VELFGNFWKPVSWELFHSSLKAKIAYVWSIYVGYLLDLFIIYFFHILIKRTNEKIQKRGIILFGQLFQQHFLWSDDISMSDDANCFAHVYSFKNSLNSSYLLHIFWFSSDSRTPPESCKEAENKEKLL
jgi:hypothetical protein